MIADTEKAYQQKICGVFLFLANEEHKFFKSNWKYDTEAASLLWQMQKIFLLPLQDPPV